LGYFLGLLLFDWTNKGKRLLISEFPDPMGSISKWSIDGEGFWCLVFEKYVYNGNPRPDAIFMLQAQSCLLSMSLISPALISIKNMCAPMQYTNVDL
jgi:hypothetical protein